LAAIPYIRPRQVNIKLIPEKWKLFMTFELAGKKFRKDFLFDIIVFLTKTVV